MLLIEIDSYVMILNEHEFLTFLNFIIQFLIIYNKTIFIRQC